jgi:hypothetical protein
MMLDRIAGLVAGALLLALPQATMPLGRLSTATPIAYFIADGSRRSGFEPGDRELAQWALDAWKRTAGTSLRLQPTAEADARIRIYWAPPGLGQYGETEPLLLNGERGANVFIHPEMDALGDDVAMRARMDPLLRDAIVYLTCLHELGHAFGLEHTAGFDDIMYSFQYGGNVVEYFDRYRRQIKSRADIATVDGLSNADRARFRALYATEAR